MFHKILIPLDGSPLAEHVITQVQRLAPPATTALVLVSVIEPWRYSFGAIDFTTPNLVTFIRTSTQEYMDGQRTRLQAAGYQVDGQIVDGDPAQEILDAARRTGADLIALSTHGRSGFVRWALGSVAERVIQGATLPIFLVRERTMVPVHPLRRLLVPLDGSTLAEWALPPAQALAQESGASLLLLQVVQDLDEGSRRILFESEAAAEATIGLWRAEAEAYLEGAGQALRSRGVPIEVRALVGDPNKAICDTVAKENIDLMVMSTHGRSGLNRWVYGSVANKVLRGASCPLLLVRNLQPAKADEQASPTRSFSGHLDK
jgi:nucleotide-binding universal stress UspA family protein